jgi:4-amino-4-deoxy-L-arabinose transferase-like glycosyltransferase
MMRTRRDRGANLAEAALALAACLAGAVVLRLPALDMPLDRDASVYATIGHLLPGSLPYADLIDHKQPVVYPVYWLLDGIAPGSHAVVRVASALAGALAAWLLFLGLRGRIGTGRAAGAAGLALVLGASRYVQGFELNTEHLLVLTGTLAVVVALACEDVDGAWAPLLVGALCALAVLTKAVGILLAPAALVPLLRGRPPAGVLVRFALGLAAPLLLVAAVYAAHGALGDLVTWNWTYNRQYASTLTLSERIDNLTAYPADVLLIGVATGAAVIALISRGPRDTLALTLAAWLAGAVVGAVLAGYGYAHYFAPATVPAAALLATTIPARGPLRWAVAAAAAIAVAPFALDLARGYGRGADGLADKSYGGNAVMARAYEPVGRLVRARARSGDRLYVAGNEAGFYWQARLTPASRLLYDSPLALRPQLARELQRDLCARPPRFLILPLGTLPAYARCLGGRGYREVAAQPPSVLILQRG